jgi:hypothetical protein
MLDNNVVIYIFYKKKWIVIKSIKDENDLEKSISMKVVSSDDNSTIFRSRVDNIIEFTNKKDGNDLGAHLRCGSIVSFIFLGSVERVGEKNCEWVQRLKNWDLGADRFVDTLETELLFMLCKLLYIITIR